jgi:hypothetical protein
MRLGFTLIKLWKVENVTEVRAITVPDILDNHNIKERLIGTVKQFRSFFYSKLYQK